MQKNINATLARTMSTSMYGIATMGVYTTIACRSRGAQSKRRPPSPKGWGPAARPTAMPQDARPAIRLELTRREQHFDAAIQIATLLRRHGADGLSLAEISDVDATRIHTALDQHGAHDLHAARRKGTLLRLSLGGVTVQAHLHDRVGSQPRDEVFDLARAVREH